MLLAAANGCGPGSASNGEDVVDSQHRTLTITGSSTLAPLVTEIARRFEAKHPGVRVNVQSGGSSQGITDVRRGLARIAMVSRELASEEGDLRAHTLALDGVGLIVHRDNPFPFPSAEQVRDIFTGRVRDWSDVGAVAGPITVVNKAEGRGTLDGFLGHFGLLSREIRADVVVGENQHGIRTVVGVPGAIGYVSIGAAEREVAGGAPVRLLPLDGVPASTETVATGRYPLIRSLHLVTLPEPDLVVEAFIAFALSDEVTALFEELGFVQAIH